MNNIIQDIVPIFDESEEDEEEVKDEEEQKEVPPIVAQAETNFGLEFPKLEFPDLKLTDL